MRLVLDTNVVVAGLLWNGPPNRLIALAVQEVIRLYSSQILLDELAQTLRHPKFAKRTAQAGTTPAALAIRFGALVTIVSPSQTPRVVSNDADDDHVLACALTAQTDLIVSGDKHLHGLGGTYQGIRIVTPAEAMRLLNR
jgi:putative PIN family toxin of toxin-antitoxin system